MTRMRGALEAALNDMAVGPSLIDHLSYGCNVVVKQYMTVSRQRLWDKRAQSLDASHLMAMWTVTMAYLKRVIVFLMSFENFNTTLMLVGSEQPLTIAMYGRLCEGSTLELNTLSLLLMAVTGRLSLMSVFVQRDRD